MMPSDPIIPQLRLARRGVALAGLLALATCAAPPPPPTVINVTVTATATVNNTAGVGAPVTMRIYQLAGKAAFEGAPFFSLYNADAATLTADLIKKDEFVLAPGQSKTLKLTPLDPVKAIGVFAAYRDYANVVWRGDVDVTPNKTVNLTVTADAPGIALATAPAP